jgi:hypothetical protein
MIKKYMHYYINKSKRFQYISAGLVILVVASLGTILLIGSHAASPYASTTADSGTLSGGATKQTCTGASDGNCVVFDGTSGGSQQTNCFSSPGACGYPDPTSGSDIVGANTCEDAVTSLATIHSEYPDGTYVANGYLGIEGTNANNITLSNINLGNMTIEDEGNNLTLNNVCMNVTGGSQGDHAIQTTAGTTGLTVENSTISGTNDTTEALGAPIDDLGSGTVIKNNYFYNMGGGTGEHGASATIENNYMNVNALPLGDVVDGVQEYEHDEDIYCTDNTVTISHNVLLNNQNQTATIFCNTNNGTVDKPTTITGNTTVDSNVITGLSYPSPNTPAFNAETDMVVGEGISGLNIPYISSVPSGAYVGSIDSPTQIHIVDANGNPVNATATASGSTLVYGSACDNHLTITDNFLVGGGYVIYPCGNASTVGTSTMNIEDNRFGRCLSASCPDSHGYWPKGGYNGIDAYNFPGASETWSGNYWDDNLQAVSD